jgi:hypothetical protein
LFPDKNFVPDLHFVPGNSKNIHWRSDMPPRIVSINRIPLKPADCDLGTIDLTDISIISTDQILNEANSSENLLNRLKDWMEQNQPALLGVKPEESLYIYTFDQSTATSWQVIPGEWTKPIDLMVKEANISNPKSLYFSLKVKIKILGFEMEQSVQFPILEIKASVPEMTGLEISRNYERNGLAMPMTIKIINNLGEKSNPWLPIPVWLPFPHIGQYLWNEKQHKVRMNTLDKTRTSLSLEEHTNYLGRKAKPGSRNDTNAVSGQVRWYSLDKLPQMNILSQTQDAIQSGRSRGLCFAMPGVISSKLSNLRRSGQWLYDEVTHWDDNSVQFSIPAEPGVAIIWRDDLPSKPIVCFDLLKYTETLAKRLWRPVLNNGALDLDIPIPVGQMIRLGVARLEDAVNNELVKALGPTGLKVSFAFVVKAIQNNPNIPSTFGEKNFVYRSSGCLGNAASVSYNANFEPKCTGVSSQTVDFRYQPIICDHDLCDEESGAFSVQLNVMVQGTLTILGNALDIQNPVCWAVGPEIRFHPQSLNISKLWQPVLADGTLDLDIPIPVGETIKLKVQRIEDTTNKALTKLLLSTGQSVSVKFAFLAKALTQYAGEASSYIGTNFQNQSPKCVGDSSVPAQYLSFFGSSQSSLSNTMLEFKYIPQIYVSGMTDAQAGAFTLQLSIKISGSIDLEGFSFSFSETTLRVGPAIRFHPKPIKFPTLALFFEHPQFLGKALVAMPSGTGLFGDNEIHIDANNQDPMNQRRLEIINELSRIKDLISMVDFFWKNPPLGILNKVLGQLCDIGRSVIDSHGTIENVSDCVTEKNVFGDYNFNDSISSMVMIGLPHNYTQTLIKCWEHSLRRDDQGQCLKLSIPDNQFMAAIPDFSMLFIPYITDKGIRVSLPYPDQSGLSTGIAGFNLNDKVTGIEFVQE